MLNRSLPPEARSIDLFTVKQAESTRLKNNIPLHIINAGNHDILQLEIILRSGKWYESLNGTSFFTSRMLSEGTGSKTSSAISEFFESFGIQFQTGPGNDFVTLSVFSLNKYFKEIIPQVAECLFEPSFPEKELDILKDLQIQHIRVNNEKGSYIASKEFQKLIFGSGHPYGKHLEIDDIGNNINTGLLKDYHANRLLSGMEILVTGKVDEKSIQLIEDYFGNSPAGSSGSGGYKDEQSPDRAQTREIAKPGSLQSSIRYGKKIIPKSHTDYIGLLILNELLGGFFGSRLMKNIREEKGYTYGIHSSVVNYIHDSYFAISSEVIGEHTDATMEEINKEITRLRNDKIDGKELDTVRNYMLGGFLSSLETSFSLADKFKSVYFHGLGYDFYDRYIDTIKNITPEELRELAIKYFDLTGFSLVVVRDH